MTKCAAEQGTIVRGGSGSNYGDNKTQPLSYHFLSGASHFQPATAVGAVVAKDARLLPGAAAGPAWCPAPALLSPLLVVFYN